MNGSTINIGAYEVTGIANTLIADLSSGMNRLGAGQATTLTVTVSASTGGGGVPSGTANIVLNSSLLSTQTLLPTSATESAASLPLSASELAPGTNTLTAVYSGNTIATGCCTASSPPGGGTQFANYPSATSASITVSCISGCASSSELRKSRPSIRRR